MLSDFSEEAWGRGVTWLSQLAPELERRAKSDDEIMCIQRMKTPADQGSKQLIPVNSYEETQQK
jgi:hypothetical protein